MDISGGRVSRLGWAEITLSTLCPRLYSLAFCAENRSEAKGNSS